MRRSLTRGNRRHHRQAPAGKATARVALPVHWLAGLALALATLIAFAPALKAPFQFDDLDSIPGNASIRRLWPLSIPLNPPPDNAVTGRPVVNVTLALNYALNERLGVDQRPDSADPDATFSYHVVNLLLHLLSGALLFGIVRRTLRSARLAGMWATRADAIGGVVAAAWLLHPIQAEAVDYVIQRTELLASACYLATLYAAIRAWGSPERPARMRWYVAAIVASLLGMGSKETMITAPLVVFLYDRAFRAGSWREALRFRGERLWFYALLAGTSLWALWFILIGARAETVGFNLGLSWYGYLYSQAWAIAHYLRLVFWPGGLNIDYGRDPVTGLRGVPGAVVLAVLAVATIVAWVRKPPLAFAGAWFFLILAPSSSVVPISTEIAAERRFYLPLAAVLVVLAMGAVRLAQRLREDGSRGDAWRRRLAPRHLQWAFLTLCLVLGGLTFQRSRLYRDPEALWRDAIAKAPRNPRAYHNLAQALLEKHPPRVADAEAALRRAIALDSTYLPAWPNLASVVGLQGNTAEERRLLEHVVAVSPHYVRALEQLGFLLVSLGESRASLAPLERVTAEAPSDEGFVALATAYKSLGRADDAAAALRRALALNPGRSDVMSYLGSTLTESGRAADAVPVLEEAVGQGLTTGFVYATLSLAYAETGRARDAADAAFLAGSAANGDASVLVLAGRALLVARRPDDAAKFLSEALRLGPGDPETLTRLGMAELARGNRGEARKDFVRALASEPGFPLALQELGKLDAMSGR